MPAPSQPPALAICPNCDAGDPTSCCPAPRRIGPYKFKCRECGEQFDIHNTLAAHQQADPHCTCSTCLTAHEAMLNAGEAAAHE